MKNQYKNNAKQLYKTIRSKENEFYFGIYLLKLSYGKLLEILETFCGNYINFKDQNLNHCYVQCQRQVSIVLQSQEKIKQALGEPPKLFDSLVGDVEEVDIYWRDGFRQAADDYYGKVENLFILNGDKTFALPKFIQKFFDFANQTIAYHKAYKKIYRKLFGMDIKEKRVIQCGNLKINIDEATIQYKTNLPIEISPATKEMALLMLLFDNANSVIQYVDIAKTLNLNCYHENARNEDVSREIQFIRRDLVDILRKTGITKTEINKLITTKAKLGYKLSCK